MALASSTSRSESLTGATAAAAAHGSNVWTRGVASPRRATVALDGARAATVAAPDVYDKQLLWKQHGQKKVEHRTIELLGHEDRECTFAPKINKGSSSQPRPSQAMMMSLPRTDAFGSDGASSEYSSQYSESPRTVRSIESTDLHHMRRHHLPADDEMVSAAAAIFPTESHENSILLHLARQERAREEAQKAQHKLASSQPSKDFTKVTTARPFGLSVTNRKPRRSTSSSPTDRRQRSRPGSKSATATGAAATTTGHVNGAGMTPRQSAKRRSLGPTRRDEDDGGDSGYYSETPPLEEPERQTLLSIIETQRRELEQRDKAQEDAARLVETFTTAVETFEQRLEIVERATATEMSEMKALLSRQTVATDLILHALGLSNPLPGDAAKQPSPVSRSSSSSVRRETK